MRINFRQGLVKVPLGFLQVNSDTITLDIPPGNIFTATIADGESNYTVNHRLPVPNAWTGITAGTTCWIFIDINTVTGEQTFGSTLLEPIAGSAAPLLPANNQHWFDTGNTVMKVWVTAGNKWVRRVRVFVAMMQGGSVPVSMSANSPVFTGTQVGNNTNVDAGDFLFDDDGKPIKRSNGEFFTTTSAAVSTAASAARLKFSSQLISAIADTNIAAYSMVKFSDFDKVSQLSSFTPLTGVFGLVETEAGVGDTVSVIVDGTVTNPNWDWTSAGINAMLYVGNGGTLTATPSPGTAPVAIVIDKITAVIRPFSAQSQALTDHESALDPHPQYLTEQEVLDMLAGYAPTPYAEPAFSDFTFNQPTIEVGGPLASGGKMFMWSTTNSGNVAIDSIQIEDATSPAILVTGSANDGTQLITIGSITKNSATSHVWRISGTNTDTPTPAIFIRDYTVSWQWKMYYGESISATLAEADIKGLRMGALAGDSAGTFIFIGGGYKYVAYPTTFGLKTTFRDTSTQMEVSMEPADVINVTNLFGQSVNYYVHRTTNMLGGSINIAVS